MSATAGAVQESGRTLTQAQLLGAGLQASQWPEGIAAVADPGPAWQAGHPSAPPLPQVSPACQPLVDLEWETTGSSAEAFTDFQLQDSTIVGSVDLATYPHLRASAVFASIRRAVSACSGFGYSSQYGAFHEKTVLLQAPRLGDESISFGAVSDVRGTDFLTRYDYVRVAAATVLIRQVGATVAVPPAVSTLLAPQVAALGAAQA